MVFKGLQNCSEEFYGAYNVAVLHYEGANDELPKPDITYDTIISEGVVSIKTTEFNNFSLHSVISIY